MANIPFFSFPSFASVTRFEHSLGVCHLAGLCAQTLGLSDKDRIELMLAALYHDVATPPFAHAVEDVLEEFYGFNHEEKLRRLIVGDPDELGGQLAQVYMGRSLKIHKVCQSREARQLGLDVHRIADLAVGHALGPLGNAIASDGIDLDNIDNVVRAALAMGITDSDPQLGEKLAASFTFSADSLGFLESAARYLRMWQSTRATLYGMIYASVRDFSLETMIKHAVRVLAAGDTKLGLRPSDWSLTDDQLIYERLARFAPSAALVKKMRLGEVFNNLALLWIEGHPIPKKIPAMIPEIKGLAQEITHEFGKTVAKDPTETDVVLNFYVDKRNRHVRRPLFFLGRASYFEESIDTPRIILGIFSPTDEKWDDKALETFRKRLQELLPAKCFVEPARIGRSPYPDIVNGTSEKWNQPSIF